MKSAKVRNPRRMCGLASDGVMTEVQLYSIECLNA